VKMANDRLALEKLLRDRGYAIQERDEQRKEEESKAKAPLYAAQALEAEAKAKKAKAQATGASSGKYTSDIVMDGETFAHNRVSANKTVDADQQKKVAEVASSWGQMVELSDELSKSLEAWAKAPSMAARNAVLENVTFTAQSLTKALGGGAMAEHEKVLAFNALGGQLTDASQLTELLKSVAGDKTAGDEAAKAMSARARAIRPLAHKLMRGYSAGYGYDPKGGSTPAVSGSPSAQASDAKVPMVSVATGATVMLSQAAANELEKSGKVRKP
jgi:hypothetical protein